MVEKNPELTVKTCRGLAKGGGTFGSASSEAAIRIHWRVYPYAKPNTGDEAQIMRDAIYVFMSRFVRYGPEPEVRFGESHAMQWQRLAAMMEAASILPAGFELDGAYANRFVEAVDAFDRGAITAWAARS